MGPLGTPELVAIFFLALLLFGPKELPKLGKTIGKAMTEFRRAQSELKNTFDREMKNLERETGIRELAETTFNSNSYNYDNQSAYDTSYYDASYHSELPSTTLTEGTSALQGAATSVPQITAAAGSIASGYAEAGHDDYYQQVILPAPSASVPTDHSEAAPAAAGKPANG
jgi:TatA/E family protein of Tat protein translocase